MGNHIIQLGLMSEDDDITLMEIKGKWLSVPAWLVCEWDEDSGGIYGLILHYGLNKYQSQWEEPYALYRIQMQARALKRFMLYGDRGELSKLHRRAIHIEQEVMRKHPALDMKTEVYEKVAERMNAEFRTREFTTRRVYDILSEANEYLIYGQMEIEKNYCERVTKKIKQILPVAA